MARKIGAEMYSHMSYTQSAAAMDSGPPDQAGHTLGLVGIHNIDRIRSWPFPTSIWLAPGRPFVETRQTGLYSR